MRIGFGVIVLLIFSILTSCGSEQGSGGEDYGDLMNSPAGLALTEEEHQDGWKRADCFACHNQYNIHLGVSEDGYDMAEVRRMVEEDGVSICATCHGNNGN